MVERSYFDWNATAPLRPQAAEALREALSVPGNPSSVHAEGRAARRLVEEAREDVAALVAARPGDVFFTSSGTEANMLALTPAIQTADERRPREKLLISAIEHASVRTGGRFPHGAVADIAVDADGRVDLAALADALAASIAAAGLDHARQQRDRRGAADRASRRHRARCRWPAACRCGAGGRAHRLRYQRARCRSA